MPSLNKVNPTKKRILARTTGMELVENHQTTAYMHSDLEQYTFSPSSHSAYSESHEITSNNVVFRFQSTVWDSSCPSSSPGASGREPGEAVHDAPASSTPDLLSPIINSCVSSPEVPLTQRAFNDRLHVLLQGVLDQQRRNERESSADSPLDHDSSSNEHEWITVSQGASEDGSNRLIRHDAYATRRDESSDDDAYSGVSSTDSLGVCAPSPRANYPCHGNKYEENLTHRNKRKHDDSHDVFEHLKPSDDGITVTTVENEDDSVPTKKARFEEGSFASTSSSFSYQTNETASSRKLRSLTSASSSFTSDVSTALPPYFSHPIIHPPVEPPQVPLTKGEIAKYRIKALLKRETSYRVQDGLPAGPFGSTDFPSADNSDVFGIESDFRREVVQWMLDILPPRYLKSENLYQHLICSEETRFHAMYLFSRFFLRVGECARAGEETRAMKRARRELTWDVAFCCLAISTKFYHDFLEPLFPIRNRDFLVISPQLLSHDQFEHLHRDILDAFDYEIYGVTPHAFFEELWHAIPSLQKILKFSRTRRIVRNEMWESLQQAALQWDIMRFPVSLLAAAALIEGIIVAFIDEYKQEDEGCSCTQASDGASHDEISHTKAREDVKPVSEDVVRLLGTSDVDLRACQRWLLLVTSD